MQMYVAVRGALDVINRWENDVRAKYVRYEAKPGEFYRWQLGIRPIRLYEIAFPEPQLDNILQMIRPAKSWNPKFDKYLWGLKKAMGLIGFPKEPIPPPNPDNPETYVHNVFIEVAGIGMKKDKYENGIELI